MSGLKGCATYPAVSSLMKRVRLYEALIKLNGVMSH